MTAPGMHPLRRLSLGMALPGLMALGAGALSVGCQDAPEARELTSLRRSGDATFICIGPDGQGAPLADCPQGPRADDLGLTVGHTGYELHSLVTQTLSAEVAVVRVSGLGEDGDSTGKVLDIDRSNPGVTPIRVGESPVDIVSTPGGRASFVGVAQVGLEGIYGLPTTCLFEPDEDEPRRDRTTWPACSLPSAPGDMVLLVDSVPGRDHCGSPPAGDVPVAPPGAACATDLTQESTHPGRRKLLVALPDEAKLVIIDAQDILERQAGTFAPCNIEAEFDVAATVPGQVIQPLPTDLVAEGEDPWVVYDALGGTYESRPAGMDHRDGTLLLSDQASPIIHRYDTRDVCQLAPLEPLIATSFDEPDRVVTTSRVALSPKTASGTQVVYAVDERGDGASNVIVFDVSEGVSSRVPLVRSGAPLLSHQSPDRISFGSNVQDVTFALIDRAEVDPATGVATTGIECNPDPTLPLSDPGARYRPSSETVGAGPYVMRGLFGYALLSNGLVSVIDIEDFDAACRRPRTTNEASSLDFRGCASDDFSTDYLTSDGTLESTPTVTDEVSCRAVVPHLARSQRILETTETEGISSPALRTFGRLSMRGRGLSASRLTPEGKNHPILLGVDFESPSGTPEPARVNVGSILYSRDDSSDRLVVDPNEAERVSMVLPFVEPRAYPVNEVVSVIYEGQLDRTRRAGVLDLGQGGSAAILRDDSVSFCALGVQDRELTAEVGRTRFALSEGAIPRFVARHTDYVQLTNRLYNERDDYWSEAGAACGEGVVGANGSGYALCDSLFGEGDEDDLSPLRDLTIVTAGEDELSLTPRNLDGLSAADHLEVLACCLPGVQDYRLRGGHQWIVRGTSTGFEHAVVADPESEDRRCIFDASPFKALRRGRAFELSSTACDNLVAEDVDSCGVGVRTNRDVVCSYDGTRGPVQVGGVSSECIFDGLTRRFAIYRGLSPSERDMSFGFEVVGGFRGFAISLVNDSNVVLPVKLVPLPTYNAFGVVDSQNRGLMMVDLPNAHVAQTFY